MTREIQSIIKADAEDSRDTWRQAERRLRKAGFQDRVVEVEVREEEGQRPGEESSKIYFKRRYL